MDELGMIYKGAYTGAYRVAIRAYPRDRRERETTKGNHRQMKTVDDK